MGMDCSAGIWLEPEGLNVLLCHNVRDENKGQERNRDVQKTPDEAEWYVTINTGSERQGQKA